MVQAAIPIGAFAKRAGVNASTLRFYESQGLIRSTRSHGKRRVFARDMLRRVAFIRVAQSVGLSLQAIRAALQTLPQQRTPNKADWERLSRTWRSDLDRRIEALVNLRDRFSSCIGCGCLSLKTCPLYNPNDGARARGSGPRYLLGDSPHEVMKAADSSRRQRSSRAARPVD